MKNMDTKEQELKARQERAENMSGKELAQYFRYLPQEDLKVYGARGSKAAKRELARRRREYGEN
jgi:hypothetical protein